MILQVLKKILKKTAQKWQLIPAEGRAAHLEMSL